MQQRHIRGVYVQFHSFSTSALDGVCGQIHAPAVNTNYLAWLSGELTKFELQIKLKFYGIEESEESLYFKDFTNYISSSFRRGRRWQENITFHIKLYIHFYMAQMTSVM